MTHRQSGAFPAFVLGISFACNSGTAGFALDLDECMEIGELGRQYALARDAGISKFDALRVSDCLDAEDKECQLMDDAAGYAYAASDLDPSTVKIKIVEACMQWLIEQAE